MKCWTSPGRRETAEPETIPAKPLPPLWGDEEGGQATDAKKRLILRSFGETNFFRLGHGTWPDMGQDTPTDG